MMRASHALATARRAASSGSGAGGGTAALGDARHVEGEDLGEGDAIELDELGQAVGPVRPDVPVAHPPSLSLSDFTPRRPSTRPDRRPAPTHIRVGLDFLSRQRPVPHIPHGLVCPPRAVPVQTIVPGPTRGLTQPSSNQPRTPHRERGACAAGSPAHMPGPVGTQQGGGGRSHWERPR